MQLTLPEQLSQFSNVLQQQLFPLLTPAVGPISDRAALFIAVCAMVPLRPLLPQGKWPGRPSKDRLAIARSFLAKSVYGLAHTRQLLETLKTDHALRQLCGWDHVGQLPHESTFSRAFAEFADSQLSTAAHEALIRATHSDRLVGHIARDGSAIEARERFVDTKPKKAPKAKGKKKRKKAVFAKESAACRAKRETRIQKQAKLKTVKEMLQGVPTACDIGGKKGNNGCVFWWRGYKFHLDVADGQIPISALLTAASVHDSQVAIPLMEMSSKRVTYLYEIMDSAYDASAIYQASADRNHQPIINPHTRRKSKTQLPVLVKPQPQLCPAQAERYKIRTMVERVFGRLKDEFGADKIRVRGAKKVMAHLMFSVLALTVDQLLRLHP